MNVDFSGNPDKPHFVICEPVHGMTPLVVFYPNRKEASDAALEIPPFMHAGFGPCVDFDKILDAIDHVKEEIKRDDLLQMPAQGATQ